MLTLFARGCELQAQGHDSVDDKGPEHYEFVQIVEELNWYVASALRIGLRLSHRYQSSSGLPRAKF
jgi:hypothetical protein